MILTEEMVERAAIAVHDLKMDEPGLWEKQTDSYKAVYRTGSRVALAAALEGLLIVPAEPTMAMLAAGQKAWIADPLKRSTTLYKAMVEASPLVPQDGQT